MRNKAPDKRKTRKIRIFYAALGLICITIVGNYIWDFITTESKVIAFQNPPCEDSLAISKKHDDCDSIMEYVYNAPESANDNRYEYHWEILKTALEKTKSKYGPYQMIQAKFMTEKRQLHELKTETNEITVMYLDTKPNLERELLPIRIPVDKNLGGYRVMLIRKENQQKFTNVRDIDELRNTTFGLGRDWVDVEILIANNFKVITGSNYEGLFKMLINKRFDVFSRSAVEILDEYDKRKDELSDLAIEDSLLLYYPLPMYFWFSKTKKGELLAQRAKEGMEMMIKDGTYDKIFDQFHGYKTKKLHLKKRRIFKIDNPLLVQETPFHDKRLWFDPIHN